MKLRESTARGLKGPGDPALHRVIGAVQQRLSAVAGQEPHGMVQCRGVPCSLLLWAGPYSLEIIMFSQRSKW